MDCIEKNAFEKKLTLQPETKNSLVSKYICETCELDFDEVPALLLAVERGRSDMVGFLLEKGARVNQRDDNKRTALSIASRKNNFNLVSELIKFGANPDRSGPNKETPLIIASRFGNFEAVKALLVYHNVFGSATTSSRHSYLLFFFSKWLL